MIAVCHSDGSGSDTAVSVYFQTESPYNAVRCATQDAALPEDDELMELKLKLVKDDTLGSTIGELSSFSEMGEHTRHSVLMSARVAI